MNSLFCIAIHILVLSVCILICKAEILTRVLCHHVLTKHLKDKEPYQQSHGKRGEI